MSAPRIGLLGATGYTGRLTAEELARRGVTARLGGRSQQRLAAVAQFGETVVVDTTDPAGLTSFLTGLDAVISCVGPFDALGRPVVAAAVAQSVPYVDSTGEPAFMTHVYDSYADADSPVVPACGMDYIPGDLAAAIAAEELGTTPAEILVGYRTAHTRPSRGTVRSAAGALTTVDVSPRLVTLPFPDGERAGVILPWGEAVTVPRHQPRAVVATAFVVPSLVAKAGPVLGAAAPVFTALKPLLPRLTPLLERLAERVPEGPPDHTRATATCEVLAIARTDDKETAVRVALRDVYGLTAVLLVEAALRVGDAKPGAQAPAQAFDPRGFLDAVSGPLLTWQVIPR